MLNTLYEIPGISSGFFADILNIITFISIMSAILIVIAKNPIVSVLYLIFLFSNISVNLIFIGLSFIGLAYLLVYVGAVSILFLFILMLINIRVSELTDDTNNNIPLAILVILAFFIPISNILPKAENKSNTYFLESLVNRENIKYVSSNNWEGNLVDVLDISSVGNVMYTSYFIWLFITSLILLLAMVGSIVITVKQKD